MTEEQTVYALPGTMCDERLWTKLNDEELHFSIHHIDIPQDNSMEHIIQSLEKILPDEPVNLLGFSLGGYIASAFCSKNYDRVKKLAVLSNSPTTLPNEEVKQREQLVNWVEKHGYSGITENKIKFLLHENNIANADIIQLIFDMDKVCGEQTLLNQLKATTYRSDLSIALAATNARVGFFYGRQDKLINEKKLESLANSFVNITTHKIETAGHMLPLESPNMLAEALNSYFEERKSEEIFLSL